MNRRRGAIRAFCAVAALAAILCTAWPVPLAGAEEAPAETAAATEEVDPEAPDDPEAPADPPETETPAQETEAAQTEQTETEPATPEETTAPVLMQEPGSAMTFAPAKDGGICLAAYRWLNESEVEIPAEYDGKPVTEIGESAFKYCYADFVHLPETVRIIGDSAFENCAYLQSVEIPAACERIGERAFSGCKALGAVTVPDSLTAIGKNAFDGTPFLADFAGDFVVLGSGILYAYKGSAGTVTVPENVHTVAPYAFADCENLTAVTLPDSVRRVQEYAFSGCTALKTVSAPAVLEELAGNALTDTAWLSSSSEDFVTLGKMLVKYSGKETAVTVPEGILIVNDSAFAGQTAVTTVHLPDSVTEVRKEAFAQCSSLQVAVLGENIQSIGEKAFSKCSTLNYLRVGHQLQRIGAHAFAGCPRLAEIYLPDTLLEIGEEALGYYESDETGGFAAYRDKMTLYANTAAARNYANEHGLTLKALPLEENTDIPEITTQSASGLNIGSPQGSAWVPAAILSGTLLLTGIIAFFVRRKRQ